MEEREVERLVEAYLWLDLKEAEEALVAGKNIDIEVLGSDLSERLSHISAALWILEMIRSQGCDFATAMEAYQSNLR